MVGLVNLTPVQWETETYHSFLERHRASCHTVINSDQDKFESDLYWMVRERKRNLVQTTL